MRISKLDVRGSVKVAPITKKIVGISEGLRRMLDAPEPEKRRIEI